MYPELLEVEALAVALLARRTAEVLEAEGGADDLLYCGSDEVETWAAVEATTLQLVRCYRTSRFDGLWVREVYRLEGGSMCQSNHVETCEK